MKGKAAVIRAHFKPLSLITSWRFLRNAQLGADPEVIEEIIYLLYVAKLQTQFYVLCNFYNNKNCAAFKCFSI